MKESLTEQLSAMSLCLSFMVSIAKHKGFSESFVSYAKQQIEYWENSHKKDDLDVSISNDIIATYRTILERFEA